MEGGGYLVSWCVGHLVELSAPERYARLLFGKKTAYAEYWKLRDEAQELLIVQSNIGSIYDFAGGKLLRQEKEEQKR